MRPYYSKIIDKYLYTTNKTFKCLCNMNLFSNEKDIEALDNKDAETFHTFVMKCMFVANYDRPDILTGISYLSTNVLNPYKEDIT